MTTQNTERRLSANTIEQETLALGGLRGISDYRPLHAEASLEGTEKAASEMLAARALEADLKAQLQAATKAARLAEWKFHNHMLAVKESVIAQFGPDSPQAQAVGRKRKSTYKRPTRKKKQDSDQKGE